MPEAPASRSDAGKPHASPPKPPETDTGPYRGRTGAAIALGVLATVVMGAALVHAFLRGDFASEGAALVASPWGLATLTEAYVGFALFGGWVAARERRAAVAAGWIVALLLGGNVVAGAYVVLAAWRSAGDSQRFWTGEPRAP